jgi:hypothetical protein
MIIKDLEVSKELSRKELAAVRGGSTNLAFVGGAAAFQGGLLNIGSPQTVSNSPVVAQPNTELDINSAVIANSLAAVFQL